METNQRKRHNTPVDANANFRLNDVETVTTKLVSVPVYDKWAGMSDDDIVAVCSEG